MIAWASSGVRRWVLNALVEGGHPYYLGSFQEQAVITWLGGRNLDKAAVDIIKEGGSEHILSTFPNTKQRTFDLITPDKFRFFLDSGAYSAWTRGSVIDIDEYCAFIRANIEHIDVYPCLDVIPGKPGQIASDKERDRAADETWANYLYMVGEGLDPIPVYHYGEDMRHLERMLAHGCGYIGIGGLVAVPSTQRRLFLDRLFKRIVDSKGMPMVKTHGFGMTSVPLMFRYPWFSVDSSTWIQQTMSGNVYLPAVRNGAFVFDEIPKTVVVSNGTPKNNADCAINFSPAMRAILDRWLAECGKTLAEVAEHYYHRAVVNVTFFKRVSELAATRPFKTDEIRKQSFFD